MHDILDWQPITSQEQVITISRDSNPKKLHEKDLTMTNVSSISSWNKNMTIFLTWRNIVAKLLRRVLDDSLNCLINCLTASLTITK